MKSNLLILLLTLLLAACATQTPMERSQQAFSQGKTNFLQGNYRQAFQELLPLAEDGNADAQYAIAYMYYYGQGVPQDVDVAKSWMKKAASQGQFLAKQALISLQVNP